MTSSGARFTDVESGNKRIPACYGYINWKLTTLMEAMDEIQNISSSVQQFVKLAKRRCTHPDEFNLTKEESAALYLYTMEMGEQDCIYAVLNQTLRDENRSKVRPWFAYLHLLHIAVNKLPKFKGVVWRGVNKDISSDFKKGQQKTWWSITSCSRSVDVISSFIGEVPQSTLFNIQCTSGRSISNYTSYPSEDEVILMPGTKFTVVADPLHHHGGLHIVHLEEIPDEDDDDKMQDQKPAKETTITKSMGKLDISELNFFSFKHRA